MVGHKLLRAALLGTAIAAVAGACSPVMDQRGHVVEKGTYEKLETGKSTKDDVLTLLGSPSTTATFDNETWYYISQNAERVIFSAPVVREQRVVAITFEQTGTIKDMANYTLKDGKVVAMVDRKTPTAGRELTYIEQVFGNVGKYNKPAGAGGAGGK